MLAELLQKTEGRREHAEQTAGEAAADFLGVCFRRLNSSLPTEAANIARRACVLCVVSVSTVTVSGRDGTIRTGGG